MSFDWSENLRLAEYMHNKVADFPDSEACYRAAIGRAYYFAYCSSQDYVRSSYGSQYQAYRSQQSSAGRGGSSHQILRGFLTSQLSADEQLLGSRLQALHQLRKNADYESHQPPNPSLESVAAITSAREIKQLLSRLS